MTIGTRPRACGVWACEDPSESVTCQSNLVMQSPPSQCKLSYHYGAGPASNRTSHQRVETDRLVLHFGVLEHPGHDVRIDRQAFEFAQPLRLRIQPFYHLGRLFIALRVLLDERAHLLGPRGEAVRLHELTQDQAERHAPPRLLLEHLDADGQPVRLHAAAL